MAGLLENDLDAYSKVAVPLIMARFPEWERFAKLSPRPDGAGNVVDFNIPCPSPVAESGLWVSTADEELSVGFHTHHNHFTDYESPLNREQIEAGIQYAADIVEERAGVVSWYRGDRFAGSCSVELPHPGPLPGLLDGLDAAAELADTFSDGDRVTLRSWFGRSRPGRGTGRTGRCSRRRHLGYTVLTWILFTSRHRLSATQLLGPVRTSRSLGSSSKPAIGGQSNALSSTR